jgi:ABC-type multidrug transport system ATPase subunit
MLSIGRALMTHPALLILDEATEGLAPQIVAEIWRVIGEIRRDGIATSIVDQVYRRALAHADQALVLQKGRVVLNGAADEVAASAGLSAYLRLEAHLRTANPASPQGRTQPAGTGNRRRCGSTAASACTCAIDARQRRVSCW